MPEPRQSNQLIGGLIMLGAVISCVIAALIYTDVLPVGSARGLATGMLGVMALGEFAMGVWFLSKGESS